MDTQPRSAHLASLARCFLSFATKAADTAVTHAAGKILETSGDVTVKSKQLAWLESTLQQGHPLVVCDFFRSILTPYLHLDTNAGSPACLHKNVAKPVMAGDHVITTLLLFFQCGNCVIIRNKLNIHNAVNCFASSLTKTS